MNNLIFEAKLKDISLSEYKKIISSTIVILFLSQQLAYAHPSMIESNRTIEFLDNYGPPLILTAVDLIKLSIPLFLHMKNLRITSN